MDSRYRMVAATAMVALVALVAVAPASATNGWRGRFDRPRHGFAPASTVLRDGDPAEVGMNPAKVANAQRDIADWTERSSRGRPMYAGAVGLYAHAGTVVSRRASGYESRYADADGNELPRDQWEPVRPNTLFDLASMTKVFTSVAVMQQVERERVELDSPVARYLPEFAANGKGSITVRQLLTHTSGLQPEIELWKNWPDRQSRIKAVMDVPPQHAPGSSYAYSDLNMITLGLLVERVTGSPLDRVVHDNITAPLGMRDTTYNPPASEHHRIAATEDERESGRGMLRGSVHDENAWSLGGVAGHAGLFSTADDLAVFGQALLNGGSYGGARILRRGTVGDMLANHNREFPGNSHGLGFELDQRWYMAGLSGPRTAGHTGFTGTSLVLDPASRSVAVLLTNRVHPSRDWGSNNPARERFAAGLAQALAVPPRRGDSAWYSSGSPDATARLSTGDLPVRGSRARVSFDAFVDTQRDPDGTDALALEASTDSGRSWQRVPLRATGRGAPAGPHSELAGSGHRGWWRVRAELPVTEPNLLRLRWRYDTDDQYSGRGVYLDGIGVHDERGTLLDAERNPAALRPSGWRPRPD